MLEAHVLKKSVIALAIAAILGLSGGALVGCGGGSGSSSSNTENSSSSAENKTNSSSDDVSLKDIESEMTEAYMGITDTDEGFYYAGNADGSLAIVMALNNNGESVSFVGPAESQGNMIRVTDVVTNNTLTFSVEPQADGTLLLDMGDAGAALVAECKPSEVIAVMEQIDTYATALA
ncbi:MAG: hypothetical protein VB027_04755 [Gordonibacter sp.]|nr:hypothetical protein [Gordonibacter sp.]